MVRFHLLLFFLLLLLLSEARLEKMSKSGISLQGNFLILTEKIKEYIREICYTGGKFGQTGGKFWLSCREINIFFQAWSEVPNHWCCHVNSHGLIKCRACWCTCIWTKTCEKGPHTVSVLLDQLTKISNHISTDLEMDLFNHVK